VGNYIEESVSLRETIELGTGRNAISSLFGGALRGWRSQAYYDVPNAVRHSLVDSLAGCLPARYRSARRDNIESAAANAEALRAKYSPGELEQMLRRLPAAPHSDLHGKNVRVCGAEAILIDFNSVAPGPLVADPATLDVALVMGTRILTGEAWQNYVSDRYKLEHLRVLPPSADPSDATAALSNCVRLIRQIGLADQMSEFEYPTAVAIYLIRHASYTSKDIDDVDRRRVAYSLAEQLIIALTKGTKLETSVSRPVQESTTAT